MEEDIQRDMDHLYTLLDHCTHKDILQQVRENIRAALIFVEVNIKEASSRFNRLSNEPANKALSSQKNSSQLGNIIKLSTKITKPINKQKHELKLSLLSKLQSLNSSKSAIGM